MFKEHKVTQWMEQSKYTSAHSMSLLNQWPRNILFVCHLCNAGMQRPSRNKQTKVSRVLQYFSVASQDPIKGRQSLLVNQEQKQWFKRENNASSRCLCNPKGLTINCFIAWPPPKHERHFPPHPQIPTLLENAKARPYAGGSPIHGTRGSLPSPIPGPVTQLESSFFSPVVRVSSAKSNHRGHGQPAANRTNR